MNKAPTSRNSALIAAFALAHAFGKTPERISEILGCSRTRYFQIKKEPNRATVGDLRKLYDAAVITEEQLLELIGGQKAVKKFKA